MNRFTRVFLRTILWIVGVFIAFVLLLVLLIRMPTVQNYIVGKVTNYLEQKIGTPVSIGYVNITFPKKIVLENVYFSDQSRDTLIAGERLMVDIDMFKLFKNTVKIQEIDLEGITSTIKRDSTGKFNFDYIVETFASPEQATTTTDSTQLIFDIGQVTLERIHVDYTDELISTSANIKLKHLDTKVKTFDLSKNMSFNLPNITIDGLSANIKQWEPLSSKEENYNTMATQDLPSNSLLPSLGTNTINLSNIFVKYQDEISKLDSKFDIKKLSAKVDTIDLNKENIRLKEIILDESDSYVVFNKNTAPKNKTENTTESSNWIVSSDKISINKTNFYFKDDNEKRMKGFDYFNIGLKDIAGSLNSLYYSNDSISGDLKNLTAKDHSGFYLKQLKGEFIYTNTGALIKGLIAQTPNSIIQDYVKITYPSLEAVSKSLDLLNIDANISKTTIDLRDVQFFVPEMDTISSIRPLLNQSFYINGKVIGRLNNLRIPSLQFKTLQQTEIIANATIKGLPNLDKTDINLHLKKLITGKNDLDKLIDKSLLPQGMEIVFPTSIALSGNFNGGMSGFDTDLQLITDKGNANLKGQMNLANKDTTYEGTISIDQFNIGHFIKQDSILGVIAAEATIKGKGLNPKTMVTDVQGSLNRLDAMGYTYHDINLDAKANQGLVTANVTSNDSNIRFNLEATAKMESTYPKVNFTMMVDSINLQNLKLTSSNVRYHGQIEGDFETADIDYLNGQVAINNSFIAYDAQRFALKKITLDAIADTSRNQLILNSEFLKAHLVGKYQLSQLGDAIQDVIKIYYNPDGSLPTTKEYSAQNFEFSATLTSSRFLRDFLPDLEKLDNISLDGNFNSSQNSFMAKLVAPELLYAGIHIVDVGLDIITFDSTLYYSSLINKIKYNNIELNNTTFSGQVKQNDLEIGLWIKDNSNKDRYHLGGKLDVFKNDYTFSLNEDGLLLNYDKWDIASDNELSFGPSGVKAYDFRLSRDNQELLVQSADSTMNSPLTLSFNNFRIETLANMLESETLKLGGGINGEATISRLESKPVLVSDIDINKVYFGKDTIGDIGIKVNNLKENTYHADISISEYGNDVQLLAEYFSPPNDNSSFTATLNINALQLKTIEAFSLGYLKNNEGDISGSLKLTGDLDKPKINGALSFNKAKINISMLNADLLINDQKIQFNDQGIIFKQFELKDIKGNKAKVNGSILTNTYRDFNFNLNVTTYNFAVVNSTRNDNDLFYGKLYVTSNLRIKGNLDQPIIDGNITANENTDFVFIVPTESPGVTEREGVVKFVNKSDTTQSNIFAQLDSLTTVNTHLSGFDLALNLSTSPDANFKVILNEGSQDALNIQGIAELTTAIDASNKITMSGTFTVVDGNYSFSFGPIKKEFGFQSGSTITWNGDPLDARLNITALYSRRFSPLELVLNQIGTDNQNLYRQKIPFDVKLILTGELFKPDINFDIDVDNNNAIVSQDVLSKVDNALAALRNDPAEMNKQVFSLIVLGNFMSSNPFGGAAGGASVEGWARNSMSSFLSNQLNNLASELIKGVDLDFNLQSDQDYLTGSLSSRTDLNVDVSKMLFDDRLKITIGSNFEVEGQSRPGENPNNIAGDISIEYQLSQDGRYFIRAYRKNQYQATLQGQFVETGIGFIVNISYDKFREIFMSAKALEDYYNTDNSNFRSRFDVERMETDSIYRDSVRLVVRDSLMLHSPQFRKRMEEKQKEEQANKKGNSLPKDTTNKSNIKAIRNEDEERSKNEK